MALFSTDGEEEVSRTMREELPRNFALRIQSFSLLSNSSLERYDSGDFYSQGYYWKLCLYPKGNKVKNGEEHISLYLEILEKKSFCPGWEVHASFRLFLLDQLNNKYLTLQDAKERRILFCATNIQSGFDRFITLNEFNDPTKGYLVDDTCVFGAEVVSVHKWSALGYAENLLMTAGPVTCNHTWKIDKFSQLDKDCHSSQVFTAGLHKWRIDLYPKGNAECQGKSISLYLELDDSTTLPPGRGVYVEAQLRVMDQFYGEHVEYKLKHWFTETAKSFGWNEFISLGLLRNQSKGYLVKDVCIIEAHILLTGAIRNLGPT